VIEDNGEREYGKGASSGCYSEKIKKRTGGGVDTLPKKSGRKEGQQEIGGVPAGKEWKGISFGGKKKRFGQERGNEYKSLAQSSSTKKGALLELPQPD